MITVERDGDVRVIALARPPVNAINLALIEALTAAVAAAGADDACRAIVLTGAEAIAEAAQMAALPAYRAVKTQLRAATTAKLAHIVEHDDEPMLAGWIET